MLILRGSGAQDTSWWLNQPFEKYANRQNGFIFSKFRVENQKIFELHYFGANLMT